MVKAALGLLEMDFETIQAKHDQDGKAALKNICHGLDHDLRSKNSDEKLNNVLQAIQAVMPCLTAQALA